MDFFDIIELSQIRALRVALHPTLESIWRAKCREYSRLFYTPLHEVHELDAEFVLQNLYESHYHSDHVKENLPEVLERLYKMRDPGYEAMEQDDVEELVDAVLMKEMKRKGEVRKDSFANLKEVVELPKFGGMKFDNMEKVDQIAELGKSGFKDE